MCTWWVHGVCRTYIRTLTHLSVVQDGGAGQLLLPTASGQGFGQGFACRCAQHKDGAAHTLLVWVWVWVGVGVGVRVGILGCDWDSGSGSGLGRGQGQDHGQGQDWGVRVEVGLSGLALLNRADNHAVEGKGAGVGLSAQFAVDAQRRTSGRGTHHLQHLALFGTAEGETVPARTSRTSGT